MKIRGLVWASALMCAVAGCAPRASSVPLGLGPLAVAERDAELTAAQTKRRSDKPARAVARARPATAGPLRVAKDDDDDPKPATKPAPEDGVEGKVAANPTAPAFEGLYAGADIAVFRLTGFPEREQRDDKAKIRIDKAAAGNVNITLINSEDGSDLCQLVARVEGNAALIESAQPCFSDGGEGSLEAELTSGRAVLEGDRLKMDAEGTLSVALPDQEIDGQLSYSFKGERQ